MNISSSRPLLAPAGHYLLRLGGYSLLLHRRSMIVALFLSLLLVAVATWILAAGDDALTPSKALHAAIGEGEGMLV